MKTAHATQQELDTMNAAFAAYGAALDTLRKAKLHDGRLHERTYAAQAAHDKAEAEYMAARAVVVR